jgi:hypothetical protein
MPFSEGPAICPGRNLVLMLTGAILNNYSPCFTIPAQAVQDLRIKDQETVI